MPTPSSTSASQINAELGVGSTTALSLSNNWVRNVATVSSGTIAYSNTRYGINFPGGILLNNTVSPYAGTKTPNYSANSTLVIFGEVIDNTPSNAEAIAAGAALYLRANGQMTIRVTDNNHADTDVNRTWINSGDTNSDYTAQFQITSGLDDTVTLSGSSANTDHSLSADRYWSLVTTTMTYNGSNSGIRSGNRVGNLIIKNSTGTTLISRPLTLEVYAEMGFP